MQEIVIEIMNRFGYLGIGLLIVVETVFPPIPSEVILTFSGFLTTCSKMTVTGVIFVSTAASVASAFLLYGAGSLLSPQRLGRLLDSKICKKLGFKKEEISDTLKWFDGQGRKAVFFGRCVPIVRSLISIPAGMARMNLAVFTVFTVAGSLIWDTVLVVLGAVAGESWGIITEYLDTYSALAWIVMGTVAVTFALRVWRKKKKKECTV